MLLYISLFKKGVVHTSHAVSLFLRADMHLSRRTCAFGALFGKITIDRALERFADLLVAPKYATADGLLTLVMGPLRCPCISCS